MIFENFQIYEKCWSIIVFKIVLITINSTTPKTSSTFKKLIYFKTLIYFSETHLLQKLHLLFKNSSTSKPSSTFQKLIYFKTLIYFSKTHLLLRTPIDKLIESFQSDRENWNDREAHRHFFNQSAQVIGTCSTGRHNQLTQPINTFPIDRDNWLTPSPQNKKPQENAFFWLFVFDCFVCKQKKWSKRFVKRFCFSKQKFIENVFVSVFVCITRKYSKLLFLQIFKVAFGKYLKLICFGKYLNLF